MHYTQLLIQAGWYNNTKTLQCLNLDNIPHDLEIATSITSVQPG